MAKELLTEDEIEIIKACLVAVSNSIKLDPFVNSYGNQEYYIDKDLIEYKLLAPNMVKTLKKLAENY